MAYHHLDGGLDNVYIENGFEARDTPYGKGVSIHRVADLHKTIGNWLVGQPVPISGAELRFLRLEMALTQRNLAAVLGATERP